MKELRYCTNCVMPETRPRITFDEHGVCNACRWAEEKKKLDWNSRWTELEKLCTDARGSGSFDCIVPVSGGKDSSYVAYMMKHKMGMRPLCVTITPGLPLPIGQKNLRNFITSGYDLLQVDVNPKTLAKIDRYGLTEFGRPMLGWMTAVQAAVFRIAVLFNIPLVMFGEEGETEYGGSSKLKNTPFYDVNDAISIYLSGSDPEKYREILPAEELFWFQFPTEQELRKLDLKVAKFSYFENWDPYNHYIIAKEHCGLQESEERIQGTYNNFAQTDTMLYNLHVYFMYLKFGFGRCTQDVGIDIRRGALTRKQGLTLARRYDRELPDMYLPFYLDYYNLSREEYDAAVSRHVNRELFDYVDGSWTPRFEIK